MEDLSAGQILIAEPFLKDPNFLRTAILLCDHNEEGSFGLVLNRITEFKMNEVFPAMVSPGMKVYYGGPVEKESLHILHTYAGWADGGLTVTDGIYYGGDTVAIFEALLNGNLSEDKIRFFIGYSGWGGGQLDVELALESWLSVPATAELIFGKNPENTWKNAVKMLDEKYHPIINYPVDPQLN